jgi:hypothetical protein
VKNRIENTGESDNIVVILKPEVINSGDAISDEQA